MVSNRKLKEKIEHLERLQKHNEKAFMRMVAEKDAEIRRMRELLNKAYKYGISSETYQDEKVIEEIYEYLYGGDVE